MAVLNCLARQPIIISDPETEYNINQHIEIFRDKSKQLSIDSILLHCKNDCFVPKDNISNLGFTDDAIWVKFSVLNKNPDIDHWLMEIKYYFLWEIDLFILKDQNIIEHKKSGIVRPLETLDMPFRWYLFKLFLQAEKEYTFLMRFQTYMPMTFPISIKTVETLMYETSKINFVKGCFYGILFLVVIYHLYMFGILKEKKHFYFLAFIVTLFFIRFSFDGFTRQIFFSEYHLVHLFSAYYFPVLIPVLFFFGILFVFSFQVSKQRPKIFKYTFLIIKTIWFTFALLVLLDGVSFIVPFFPVFAILTLISFILYFFFLWKNGYSPSHYYIIGWFFLVAGFFSFTLLRLNFIPSNILTEMSMEICIVVMIICFQFSFIYQTHLIRKQQQLSQLKLIEKAEENEMLVRHQKEILEQEVKQRTKELQVAKDKAEQANLDRSNFFASINHDLRTPLNSILGYAQIFQYGNKSIQDYKKGFQSIFDSGNYLLSLINDIMTVSKIESCSFELIPDIVHFKSLINRAIKLIRVLAKQKNINFTTSIDKELPDGIITDEKRLYQVLVNLMGNAVKFTEKGEVSFCVKHIENKDSLKPDDTVSIYFEIKDTGTGIDQDKLHEIFKAYRQAGKKNKRKEGTGLGLSISQTIVQLMGGTIFVDSVPGKGSTFFFEISVPVVNKKISQKSTTEQQPVIISESPKKILVVDDLHHDDAVQYVDCDHLKKELSRETNPKSQQVSTIETINKLPLIDIKEAMSNLQNDNDLFKEIIELAVIDIPEYIKSLKHHMNKRHSEYIKQDIHKLNASFKLIAAKRCGSIVDLISQKNNIAEYDLADIDSLENEWNGLIHLLKEMTKE